jgi:hypothetical protein
MSWTISIPHRRRSDPLSTVGELARHLPPDERATAREIVTGGVGAGLATVGDLLDRLEAASAAERRVLLDRARSSAGLPSVAEADRAAAARFHVAPVSDEPARDETGACHPLCAEPGCRAFPVDPATGAPQKSRARRWRCHEHRAGHEADMADWVSSIVMGPAGLIDLEAQEAERVLEQREAERRAVERAQRLAARQLDCPPLRPRPPPKHWHGGAQTCCPRCPHDHAQDRRRRHARPPRGRVRSGRGDLRRRPGERSNRARRL